MEIGHRTHVASATSYNVTITVHDDPATGDLSEDETTTTATLAPWIEFSQDLIISDTLDLPSNVVGYTSLPDLSSLPKYDPPAKDNVLIEFNTPSLNNTLLPPDFDEYRQEVGALATIYFDANQGRQFSSVTQTTGELSTPSNLDQVKVNRSPTVITQTNTPYLNNTLIDPTNSGIDLNNLNGSGSINYTNRVYDSVAGKFVRWVTTAPDSIGASYPGPGVFGVTTSDYVVERRYVL
jgi:hypothetical protein